MGVATGSSGHPTCSIRERGRGLDLTDISLPSAQVGTVGAGEHQRPRPSGPYDLVSNLIGRSSMDLGRDVMTARGQLWAGDVEGWSQLHALNPRHVCRSQPGQNNSTYCYVYTVSMP